MNPGQLVSLWDLESNTSTILHDPSLINSDTLNKYSVPLVFSESNDYASFSYLNPSNNSGFWNTAFYSLIDSNNPVTLTEIIAETVTFEDPDLSNYLPNEVFENNTRNSSSDDEYSLFFENLNDKFRTDQYSGNPSTNLTALVLKILHWKKIILIYQIMIIQKVGFFSQ